MTPLEAELSSLLPRLRKIVAEGPPARPEPDNPGELQSILQGFVESQAEAAGVASEDYPATADLACNLVFVLAGQLDLDVYRGQLVAHKKAEAQLAKLEPPLIVRP